ncbi:DEAD/DEAH box helicase [Candidatus Saccharibacteria bacterium]|nr:DEAD/DEAH box helicase [Candidatus Saccharibacteria bacterium]
MNEATTRRELIDPKLKNNKWGRNETVGSQVIAEYTFTDGRLIGSGQRGKVKKADYVLEYKNQKLAIVEAKAEDKEVTDGLEQVKNYAETLNIRYVYSTNGHGIYFFDMGTGRGQSVADYHTPDELFSMTFADVTQPQESAMIEPFQVVKHRPRYYQENAINAAVSAIAGGEPRVLLTLATGTGKTMIAFQVAWKLYQSRWNRRGDDRRPRVLFIADRNILIDQAMGDFEPLESEIVRINGEAIRKKGRIPTNGNIFFSIYQAIAGAPTNEPDKPYFMDYPADYFDLVIIDECHRGGAGNQSSWRAVLDHFSGATHLGLTATPKRDDNVDTYEYFGEPKYVYSLKQGIEDGFLTPFKVKRVTTTMDRYVFNPSDVIESGEVDEAREYTLSDFNRAIYLPEREERMAQILLSQIDPAQKTIVFCNDERHAAMIRDFINKHKPAGTLGDHRNYCVRVTATEGKIGDNYLEDFRDNEKAIPTIVTTSRKLSTGVDARNVRFIVLMRNVGSMVEFKQIVGRGTRLYDNKDYFTIVDFYGNDAKFEDPAWDGEPEADIMNADVDAGVIDGPTTYPMPDDEPLLAGDPGGDYNNPQGESPSPRTEKVVVRFSDGKTREIKYAVDTKFYMDGKPVSPEEFLDRMFGELPDLFTSEEDLRRQWSDPRARKLLLIELAERGFEEDKLQALKELLEAKNSDAYDVLRYIAYAKPVMTRRERAENVRNNYLKQLNENKQEFVQFVLDVHERDGENELGAEKLSNLVRFKYRTMADAKNKLGEAPEILADYLEIQKQLYLDADQEHSLVYGKEDADNRDA